MSVVCRAALGWAAAGAAAARAAAAAAGKLQQVWTGSKSGKDNGGESGKGGKT